MAKVRIEIIKTKSESPIGTLRRFSRRVQESNVIPSIKKNRYHQRKNSKYKTKLSALNRLEKRAFYEKQKKLGKIS